MSDLNEPQPAPTGDGDEVWPSLLADCEVSPRLRELCVERDALGRAKYGTPLRTHNGRDPLVDALQEALDLAVYLHQAAMEGRGWVTQLRALRDEAVTTAERLLAILPEPTERRGGLTVRAGAPTCPVCHDDDARRVGCRACGETGLADLSDVRPDDGPCRCAKCVREVKP